MILIRGGGDLASGVAYRLQRAGMHPVITELAKPLAVRRKVSFADAVYEGKVEIEGITGRRVDDPSDYLKVLQVLAKGWLPVLIDPDETAITALHPLAVVDGRMLKQAVPVVQARVGMIIGLGPGFTPGVNCNAAIETQRGPFLGRVYWDRSPAIDSGLPEAVGHFQAERVLRAPQSGVLEPVAEIGDQVMAGEEVARVGDATVIAPFDGVLRGLVHGGLAVTAGMKIGDLDPRNDPALATRISEKALAIGGGVLEALLTKPEIRKQLWS